jgi:hypothetical protein
LDEAGKGNTDGIIEGINAAIDGIIRSGKPSIISMSLSSPESKSLDDVVCILPVNYDHAAYTNIRLTGEKRH